MNKSKRKYDKLIDLKPLSKYLYEIFRFQEDNISNNNLDRIYGKVIPELSDSIYKYCERDTLSQYLQELKEVYEYQIYLISIAHWLGLRNDRIAELTIPSLQPSRVYFLWNQGLSGLNHIITIHHQDILDEEFDNLLNMKRLN